MVAWGLTQRRLAPLSVPTKQFKPRGGIQATTGAVDIRSYSRRPPSSKWFICRSFPRQKAISVWQKDRTRAAAIVQTKIGRRRRYPFLFGTCSPGQVRVLPHRSRACVHSACPRGADPSGRSSLFPALLTLFRIVAADHRSWSIRKMRIVQARSKTRRLHAHSNRSHPTGQPEAPRNW